MTFDDILAQVLDLLQRQGRVSYRALKRRFEIDDDYIEDLKAEIIQAKRLAVDEDGAVLVWMSAHAAASGSPSPAATPREPAATAVAEPARELLSYTPPYLAEKILTSRSALEGERKQVTVLFADIKDSTELIRDLDPEDAQKLLDPAIHIMMNAVHRFEGTVNQVLGDGIMSIFGAPLAHEDHAARACYAALAMQAAMRDYTEEVRRQKGLELRIRVGLNSGEVVVRTIGNDLHMDYSAVGPTTHLAARIERLTTPGTIRLTSATLRLVEGLVHVHALGPIPIRGLTEPVEVFELTGASPIRRRFQAAVARGLTQFVGRDAEIEALHHALEQAGAGQGQVVAAIGEPGVGKSRLAYEFVHSHRTQGWLVLESASVSYGKATPYFPVIDLLKRYVHVEDGDGPGTIRAKVMGQLLTLNVSLQEIIPAVLSLLEALPEDSPFLQLDPPQRRQRTLDGVKRMLLRESQGQPLLLVFEDLHWIDAETQALLESLVECLPTAPLLLLVTYRPEYHHEWGSPTYYTQLDLDPLPPESADALLAALLGNDASLEPLKKLLIERTEGNPFFLEESVRMLAETQILVGKWGAYRLVQELPTIQVPATVQAVLAARIDRLPQDEKRLLQTAAVIGTEVSFPLLQVIAEMPEEGLYRGLSNLQAAEFLYEASLFPERVYTFKHPLTHEVAYRSLLQERRRALHARIVEMVETLHAGRLDDQVDRLAHHTLGGEVWDRALVYCRQAGEKAMARSAHRESGGYFAQALEVLQHLPESHDMLEQAIDLRLALRNALWTLGELERLFVNLQAAEVLAETLGDSHRLGWVSVYLLAHFAQAADPDRALTAGQRALAMATALGDIGLTVAAQHYLGGVYRSLGDYCRGVKYYQKNMACLHGVLRHEHFGLPGLASVFSRSHLVVALAECGAFAEGRLPAAEGVRIAEAAEHPYSRVMAYWAVGFGALRQGDLPQAIPAFEQALALVQEAHLRLLVPMVAAPLGAAYALAGRTTEALPLLEQAVAQAVAMRYMWDHALRVVWLGEAYLLAGRLEEASTEAQRALEFARAHQERGHEAYALRLLGEMVAQRELPDLAQAETYYQQAITLANELGMRPLQAHCHRGLGTLYRQTGQAEQARAELSTAIEIYRDMEMKFWVPETEAALAAVEGQ